jgi:hypothetical protein
MSALRAREQVRGVPGGDGNGTPDSSGGWSEAPPPLALLLAAPRWLGFERRAFESK